MAATTTQAARQKEAPYEYKNESAIRRVWFGSAVGGVSGFSFGIRACSTTAAAATKPVYAYQWTAHLTI